MIHISTDAGSPGAPLVVEKAVEIRGLSFLNEFIKSQVDLLTPSQLKRLESLTPHQLLVLKSKIVNVHPNALPLHPSPFTVVDLHSFELFCPNPHSCAHNKRPGGSKQFFVYVCLFVWWFGYARNQGPWLYTAFEPVFPEIYVK